MIHDFIIKMICGKYRSGRSVDEISDDVSRQYPITKNEVESCLRDHYWGGGKRTRRKKREAKHRNTWTDKDIHTLTNMRARGESWESCAAELEKSSGGRLRNLTARVLQCAKYNHTTRVASKSPVRIETSNINPQVVEIRLIIQT